MCPGVGFCVGEGDGSSCGLGIPQTTVRQWPGQGGVPRAIVLAGLSAESPDDGGFGGEGGRLLLLLPPGQGCNIFAAREIGSDKRSPRDRHTNLNDGQNGPGVH